MLKDLPRISKRNPVLISNEFLQIQLLLHGPWKRGLIPGALELLQHLIGKVLYPVTQAWTDLFGQYFR